MWQRSEDHRGVPGAAGLVATLVADPSGATQGVAYRIADAEWEKVVGELDHREKGGYLREVLAAQSDEGAIDVVAYFADPAGALYAGPLSETEIAATVRGSAGPSGHNAEYVLRLAEALHELDIHDEHVFTVANHVMDTEHDDANVPLPKKMRPKEPRQKGGASRQHRPWRR